LLHLIERRRLRLKRPYPGRAGASHLDHARPHHPRGWQGHTAHHARHMLRDHFLVADTVLHAAYGGVLEGMCDGRDRRLGERSLHRDDAQVAGRNAIRLGGGVDAGHKFLATDDAQAVAIDRVDMSGRSVVPPDFELGELGEVSRKHAPDRAAADDADPHVSDCFAQIEIIRLSARPNQETSGPPAPGCCQDPAAFGARARVRRARRRDSDT
jgi:hypothetical protein